MSADALAAEFASLLRAATGAADARIAGLRPLTGGALQENWLAELEFDGGALPGRHELVLRRDAPSGIPGSRGRVEEFVILRAAFQAGVRVPEPLFLLHDAAGRPLMVMRRVFGEAAGRKLARDPALDPVREQLAEALGAELARVHAIAPPVAAVDFLGTPPEDAALAGVARHRRYLDALPTPHPVLEWALAWLARHAPAPVPPVLVHGDYRNGNVMLADGGVSAVLDWEFAAWGDGHEDLGWLCAKCWRFGADAREAGGIGSRAALYRGYESVAGQPPDHARVLWWEVFATARWAVIALQQAERHLSGGQRSLELALTGRMVPEMEIDLLQQIAVIEKEFPVAPP